MAVRKFSVEKFKGKLHYHGCTHCHIRYMCSCKTPAVDELCSVCRTGTGYELQRGLLPLPCCFNKCREARKDERETYKLAGPGPWWLCATCFRQFTAYLGRSA